MPLFVPPSYFVLTHPCFNSFLHFLLAHDCSRFIMLFDLELISDVEEFGLTRKFNFKPNADITHPVRVIYRNCLNTGSTGRNRKKKDNAVSRDLISKLVDAEVIKFGLCNSQNTVNIHCCTLNFTTTGMCNFVMNYL